MENCASQVHLEGSDEAVQCRIVNEALGIEVGFPRSACGLCNEAADSEMVEQFVCDVAERELVEPAVPEQLPTCAAALVRYGRMTAKEAAGALAGHVRAGRLSAEAVLAFCGQVGLDVEADADSLFGG